MLFTKQAFLQMLKYVRAPKQKFYLALTLFDLIPFYCLHLPTKRRLSNTRLSGQKWPGKDSSPLDDIGNCEGGRKLWNFQNLFYSCSY